MIIIRAADTPVMVSLWPGMDMSGATAVTLLFFVGAMGKSAQFPIHLWLPGSLFAPTPVHALLHAGIINAGGFLINRLAPLFGLSSTTLHVAFVVGTLTAILGASMMLAQNDIKKTLGFSTIGQMGYMIMECGLGAFALAVFHLIAHGLFKATVFLNCGNVIHKARQEPHFPHVDHQTEEPGLSRLTWFTGFVTTLFIPLLILLVTHGVLRIPLLESQGTVIFLFFIWITSSQAILTLTRLRQVASWKVSAAMLMTLLFIVFVYLFAVESFTRFLYPDPEEVVRTSGRRSSRLAVRPHLVPPPSDVAGGLLYCAPTDELRMRLVDGCGSLYLLLIGGCRESTRGRHCAVTLPMDSGALERPRRGDPGGGRATDPGKGAVQ